MYATNDEFVVGDAYTMRHIRILGQTVPEIKASNDIWYKCIDCDTNKTLVLPQCYIQQYGVKYD